MNRKKEKILTISKKDFKVQTFQSGGPGGQHQNRTSSGVRIIHIESGAVGESRNDKSQHRNKKLALQRLVKKQKFQLWVQRKVFEVTGGKTIEQRVEEQMYPENLKIEGRDKEGKWEKL